MPVSGEVTKLLSPPGADFDSYYDPVDLKIQELREKGLSDTQIVSELEKVGMHWDIERNITSTGTPVLDKNDPHNLENAMLREDYIQRCSILGTNNHVYSAYYLEMKAGSTAVGSGETDLHYITTHLGYNGQMAEVGIKRDLDGWYFFSNFQINGTHDVDIHEELGVPNPNTYYRFHINVTTVTNAQGWYRVDIYIDGQKIRDNWLPWRLNYSVDNNHEYFNTGLPLAGVFSNDDVRTVYRDQYIRGAGEMWLYWNDDIPSHNWSDSPIHQTITEEGGTYRHTCWSGFADEYTDDALATSRWYELEANQATANEYGDALRVFVPEGAGQAQGGYVTKNTYLMSEAEIKVEVTDFNELDEMILYIGLSSTTSSDPYFEYNWYRILKARYDGRIYVQKRIGGGSVTTLDTEYYSSATGTLFIKVTGGNIRFYDGQHEVYYEGYGLSSNNCYLYTFTSTLGTRNHGTDVFDNFEYYLLNPS